MRLPQCPGWKNVSIRAAFSTHFSADIYVTHDPDCMLYAYIWEIWAAHVAGASISTASRCF